MFILSYLIIQSFDKILQESYKADNFLFSGNFQNMSDDLLFQADVKKKKKYQSDDLIGVFSDNSFSAIR